jgi:phage terminase small subunit
VSKLSGRRKLFCLEYLIDLNGAKAAIRAGYSERCARQTAARLLTKADIRLEIQRCMDKRAARLEISAEKVLQGLAQLAFFDIRKLYNADGSLKEISELDEVTAAAICGVEVEKLYDHFGKGQAKDKGTLTKIKLADRGINLERLGRHFKLFTDRLEVDGLGDLAAQLQKARARAASR